MIKKIMLVLLIKSALCAGFFTEYGFINIKTWEGLSVYVDDEFKGISGEEATKIKLSEGKHIINIEGHSKDGDWYYKINKSIYVGKDMETTTTLIPEKIPTKQKLIKIENERKQQILIENEKRQQLLDENGMIIDINGISKFKGYENKVILLIFFTTWLPPFKSYIPYYNDLRKKYKDNFEIIALTIESNKNKNDIQLFIKKHNIKFPIKYNGKLNNNNFNNLSSLNKKGNIPFSILFNSDGKYNSHYIGKVEKEKLDKYIFRLINK